MGGGVEPDWEAGESSLEWAGQVRQEVDWEVLSDSCGRDGGFQSRSRGTEERPIIRCRDKPWALKAERQGKEAATLAAAGLLAGGSQATLAGDRPLLYLQ